MPFVRRKPRSSRSGNPRQPKDSEIISFDTFKQLYPFALEPESTDRSENVGSLGGNIVIEERVGEKSHSHPRGAHGMPESRSILDYGHPTNKPRGPSAQVP